MLSVSLFGRVTIFVKVTVITKSEKCTKMSSHQNSNRGEILQWGQGFSLFWEEIFSLTVVVMGQKEKVNLPQWGTGGKTDRG